MRVAIIGDIPDWAIGKLTNAIVRHGTHHDIIKLFAHPKDLEREIQGGKGNIQNHIEVEIESQNPSIVHFQYWRTAKQLLESMPKLFEGRKLILTHHNQKNLLSADWDELGIGFHVCHTEKAKNVLVQAGYEKVQIIQHGLDFDEFQFNKKLPLTPMVGYCGRVVPWKGLKEIAVACHELKLPLLMMGRIDKPKYWEEIPEGARTNIDMGFMNCSDEERKEFYKSITCYVGNSGDDHEEGTLPFLEAMISGVPVVSTPSGEAKDIYNGLNYEQVWFNDPEGLKKAIDKCAHGGEEMEKMRRKGWSSVKHMDERKMAREYSTLYYKIGCEGKPLVSAIVPTYNRKENVLRIIDALKAQDWPVEIIIADDGSDDGTVEVSNMGVKYFYSKSHKHGVSGEKDYGLAQMRNTAAIEAEGEFLLFCDSRLLPTKDCITKFMEKAWMNKGKSFWYFGEKGGGKDSFVENFSLVSRKKYIEGGMSCERIDQYGGMSQELRSRFGAQGFKFFYVPEATCTEMNTSKFTRARMRQIIDMKLRLWKMGM